MERLVVGNRKLIQDDENITETQADKASLCVPDKCSLLIGHGWARVPPQTQCTTTSAAEKDKEAGKKLEDKEIKEKSGEIAEEISQTAIVKRRSLKSS